VTTAHGSQSRSVGRIVSAHVPPPNATKFAATAAATNPQPAKEQSQPRSIGRQGRKKVFKGFNRREETAPNEPLTRGERLVHRSLRLPSACCALVFWDESPRFWDEPKSPENSSQIALGSSQTMCGPGGEGR
jgi:hypothetical protein